MGWIQEPSRFSEATCYRRLRETLLDIAPDVELIPSKPGDWHDTHGEDYWAMSLSLNRQVLGIQYKESWHTMELHHWLQYARRGIIITCGNFDDPRELEEFHSTAKDRRVGEWAATHAFRMEDREAFLSQHLLGKGVPARRIVKKTESLRSLLDSIRRMK